MSRSKKQIHEKLESFNNFGFLFCRNFRQVLTSISVKTALKSMEWFSGPQVPLNLSSRHFFLRHSWLTQSNDTITLPSLLLFFSQARLFTSVSWVLINCWILKNREISDKSLWCAFKRCHDAIPWFRVQLTGRVVEKRQSWELSSMRSSRWMIESKIIVQFERQLRLALCSALEKKVFVW